MKLLNFSIGQVQTIQFGSEVLKTAHIKAPIAEPWIVTDDGAAGDQRAVHPDKLYAFARTGYDYWGEQLGIDPQRWPDGFFGENLTLDGLDEQDVRVGDVFALGDEVRLVVTGARTPCTKLAWRLSQPRSFQRLFALSRQTGVYLGVLATGTVHHDDALRRIVHDPAMPSVADVCNYIASHAPPPLEPLQRLLACAQLSPTNRLLLGSKLDAAERTAAATAGRWAGWRAFKIDAIVDETPAIRSFHLRPTDGEPLYQPRPGQFVTVRMMDQSGHSIARSWSLSAFSHALDTYRLTIRRQHGEGSTWMHNAEVGSRVLLRAPAGNFVLDMGFRPVVLIAAGIGITPLLAMLQAHVARPRRAALHLIYGGRTPSDLAFRDEIEQLAAVDPDIFVHYVYSGFAAADRPAGRITAELAIALVTDLTVTVEDHVVELPWFEADIYLCGPGTFCTDLKRDFVARGANPDHIFHEQFDSLQANVTDVVEAEIHFARSNIVCAWSADEGLTLLEVAERAGIAVESDCRAGACLTCRTGIISGSTTASLDGSTLLCVARPATSRVSLDL